MSLQNVIIASLTFTYVNSDFVFGVTFALTSHLKAWLNEQTKPGFISKVAKSATNSLNKRPQRRIWWVARFAHIQVEPFWTHWICPWTFPAELLYCCSETANDVVASVADVPLEENSLLTSLSSRSSDQLVTRLAHFPNLEGNAERTGRRCQGTKCSNKPQKREPKQFLCHRPHKLHVVIRRDPTRLQRSTSWSHIGDLLIIFPHPTRSSTGWIIWLHHARLEKKSQFDSTANNGCITKQVIEKDGDARARMRYKGSIERASRATCGAH